MLPRALLSPPQWAGCSFVLAVVPPDAHLVSLLPESEVSENREHDDDDTDDVEDVAHGVPPFLSFTLVPPDPPAHWT
jgi:hypothetical protein